MPEELTGWTRSRPIRIAFLVQEGEYSAISLDGIFADCYSRWGGRFSLIVPCVGNGILPAYWPWLERFGPDIVYSYVPLGEQSVLELHERLAPSAYIVHKRHERLDVFGFKPDYDPAPLSSLSLVFKLARYAPASRDGPPVKIIDCWFTEDPSRLLTDNFGTYHHCVGASLFPADAAISACILSVVSREHQEDRRLGIPPDLLTLPDEIAAYEEYAAGKATALSIMSAQFAPRLQFYNPRWQNSFNLVLGESFADRILFWNARLLTPSWLDNDLGGMRVTLETLRDQRFLKAVGDVLRHRNHFGASGQANVTIRSTSASPEMLEEAAELLRSTKPWGGISTEAIAGFDAIVPSQQTLSHAVERGHIETPFFRRPEWTQFNWVAPIARPPTKLPEHLADAPPQQHFARGYWCADFSLEFEGTASRYGENFWKLPSRWRMARAFEHSHAGADSPTGWAPTGWRSQSGNYSTYVSESRPIATLEPPTAFSAIQWALAIDGARPLRMDGVYPPSKVGWLEPSNEARYLTGILGMIGGLDGASSLLLHPFLVNLFASFGGTTNLPPEKVVPTANRLKKIAGSKPRFDLRDERERNVLATLIVKASGALRKPMDYISYQDLSERWALHREAYWLANPQPDVPDDREDWNSHEQRALDACLIELRRRQMMFQGHQWTCGHCHHKNWLDLSELSAELTCTICKKPEDAPIDLKWLFRPNQFLIQSLRDHSVLSLVWTLAALRDRSRSSFLFVEPTWFYFDRDGKDPDAEADLLVIVDGRAVVCEVKASWAIVRTSDIFDLVALAKRLRPDTALLAVMDNGMKLENEIAAAKSELMAAGIDFELLTLDQQPLYDNPLLH